MSISTISEFKKPHFFILNMAVGGTFPSGGWQDLFTASDITALPNIGDTAEYVIDYIRIYDNGYTVLGGSAAPNFPPEFTEDPIIRPNTDDSLYPGTTIYTNTIAGSATDFEGDTLTYSYVSGPTWLEIGANGLIAGYTTNAVPGLNSWIVQVDDGNGGTDTATLQITVDKPNDPPVFTVDPIVRPNTSSSLFPGTTIYTNTIAGSATDVDVGDTLTYSYVSGPAWLEIQPDGFIGGYTSNAVPGLNSWIVQVDDGNGGTDTATLQITVDSAATSPVMSIQLSGSNLEILWPSSTAGFSLYCSTNLLPPVVWSSVTNPPIIQGDDWMVTLPIAEAPQFFQLQSP
jgi:hypothetical protein